MIRELQQFEELDVSVEGCDAYLEKLRKDCNDLMVKLHNLGAVNDELLLHVTGINCMSNSYRKVNGASAKFFCCNTPAYPLFKTPKLSPENILNVDSKDIPVRWLQSAGNISTSRITAFLELILKPISTDFCKNCPDEFSQDSRQYNGDLLNWKERLTKTEETGKQKQVFYIVAADVKALYPSLCRDTVTKALECALEKHSNFNTNAQKIIVKLNEICLNNVVTQYGDQLHTQKNGIVTGDNHSVSLANIAVHYILQPIAGMLREAALFRRFIDDIIWIATSKLSNENIRQAITSAFTNSGLELTFRQACTADQKG